MIAGPKRLELVHHVSSDPLVRWDWSPGYGRAPLPEPHTELTRAFKVWGDAGGPCDSDARLDDIFAVQQRIATRTVDALALLAARIARRYVGREGGSMRTALVWIQGIQVIEGFVTQSRPNKSGPTVPKSTGRVAATQLDQFLKTGQWEFVSASATQGYVVAVLHEEG